jgi:hypothetical protein
MRNHRKTVSLGAGALAAAAIAVTAPLAGAQVPVERNDVIYGKNRSNATETLHLIRGFPTGTLTSNAWAAPFIQSVQFDNLDGFRHAHFGNLLGVNFGTNPGTGGTGGIIWNLETRFTGGTNPGAGQQIFDFPTYNAANPTAPLSVSRLNGISVSPQNNRVAFTGSDNGVTYVLDYQAGNGTGTGAGLTNGREVQNLPTGTTAGTAGTVWLDNDNVLAISPTGEVKRVTVGAGGALSSTNVATLTTAAGTSNFSSLVYEPTLSPFVYAAISKFDGTNTTNRVFALDPANNFAVVDEADYSTSIAAKSIREVAFDSRGNLFIGHFVNTTSQPLGESIHVVQGVAANGGTLADNNSQPYYTQTTVQSAQFSGLDVAASLLDYKTPGVKVDLRNRSTVQQYFGANPVNEVRQRIQSGYAGGSWNGATGITSSNAAAQPGYGVGYGDAAELGLVGMTFGGEPVPGNAILFRLTRYGDANLDGQVNLGDFNRLAANFGSTTAVWTRGDFNYDGNVNLADFNLLAGQFGQSALGPDVTPEDWANLAAAIPEPTGLAMLGAGAATLVRRRRRMA